MPLQIAWGFNVRSKAGNGQSRRSGEGRDGLKVNGKLIDEPLPSITFIRNQPLQHGNGSFLATVGSNRDLAEEGRNAREVGDLGEEAANLDIGIFTGLQAAEELHDELVSVEDRRIRLLRR